MTRTILLLGAGKSSGYLVDYLLEHAASNNWQLIIADASEEHARHKLKNRSDGKAVKLSVEDREELALLVENSEVVISLLPPAWHGYVAEICLEKKVHFATASYLSQALKALSKEVAESKLIFLNECGLDPGIDHMSAMQMMDEIKAKGGLIKSFKSYCGGLPALRSVDNAFGYKFSWNPKNVILAGQDGGTFMHERKTKRIPYQRLFSEIEYIEISGEQFDAYANRDSLVYKDIYGIDEVHTLLRGTLRYKGFCRLWNFFVRSGFTDNFFKLEQGPHSTAELIEGLRPKGHWFFPESSHEENVALEQQIAETSLFGENIVEGNTYAEVLENLLKEKWKLTEKDTDRVVMLHEAVYEWKGKQFKQISSLDISGEDNERTAMAKTVGLPLAMAVKRILNQEIEEHGCIIPIKPSLYKPLLQELATYGITFTHHEHEIH